MENCRARMGERQKHVQLLHCLVLIKYIFEKNIINNWHGDIPHEFANLG